MKNILDATQSCIAYVILQYVGIWLLIFSLITISIFSSKQSFVGQIFTYDLFGYMLPAAVLLFMSALMLVIKMLDLIRYQLLINIIFSILILAFIADTITVYGYISSALISIKVIVASILIILNLGIYMHSR